ncbi:E3 ubiquitin-protein ligase WAV3-like isoform X2 [Diospyros lotus]|nr:E3 ubiquitin-protein ligase WAV3-like isoform X2 [Diospyros lotus]
MGSKWRKAKNALSCLQLPGELEDDSPGQSSLSAGRLSGSVLLSPAAGSSGYSMSKTPTPSSSGLLLPKQSSKSSKSTCTICLNTMKPGNGHAIFTAECSHSFHFHCITSNVKHGNQICPICRAKWKELPFQGPSDLLHGRARMNAVTWGADDDLMTVLRRQSTARADGSRRLPSFFHAPEPDVFDDDELVDHQHEITEKESLNEHVTDSHSLGAIEVKTHPEVSAVPRSASHNNFTILIHLKAPTGQRYDSGGNDPNLPPVSQSSRAPVDLVTVLDASGSMSGTKLALLKRAMGFVIQHLGPSDRLSVIAFSSIARRLFPLRRMTDTGRLEALQAVNSLISNGGTNIAEGLKKGVRVMTDRKWKNPVGSIILLSDGQDTYNVSSIGQDRSQSNYPSLLPDSINRSDGTGLQVPVHAFGFGADHDSALMHSISERSGGTFSFIEAESVIQDAFAQCIGGLLSVVVQELQVRVECVHQALHLGSIKAGSYKTSVSPYARLGFIDVGDLYAEEERNFLVTIDIPVDESCNEMPLLKVRCFYRDPITKESVNFEEADVLKIQRPEKTGDFVVSMEVHRQRNRLRAAEAMAEARAAAERGDLAGAVSVLECCRKALSETISAQTGDQLCIALDAELKEMQERMSNRRVYESSGRAYVLSGLSSHSSQRATSRGNSAETTSFSYQTPFMADMVTRSQTMFFGSPSSRPSLRQARSFTARPQPR